MPTLLTNPQNQSGFGSVSGATGQCGLDGRVEGSHSVCFLCSSSFHPISISGLVCELKEFTHTWGGPLSPRQSGTEERGLKHYWFTSWPDQKTPDRAPPLLHLVREVEEAAQQEGPHCAPIIVHCRWVLPASHWSGAAPHPLGCPAPHPTGPLGPQCRDWEDRLLHCHQHLLPAAAAGGCGGHPEDHVPAPSGQVSPWAGVGTHKGARAPRG